nr:MAG TPA: hypothetical protein [Caudoviricetes sp.]
MKPVGSPDVVETLLAEDDDVRFFFGCHTIELCESSKGSTEYELHGFRIQIVVPFVARKLHHAGEEETFCQLANLYGIDIVHRFLIGCEESEAHIGEATINHEVHRPRFLRNTQSHFLPVLIHHRSKVLCQFYGIPYSQSRRFRKFPHRAIPLQLVEPDNARAIVCAFQFDCVGPHVRLNICRSFSIPFGRPVYPMGYYTCLKRKDCRLKFIDSICELKPFRAGKFITFPACNINVKCSHNFVVFFVGSNRKK